MTITSGRRRARLHHCQPPPLKGNSSAQPPATSPVTVLADRRRLSPRKKHATTVRCLATTISQLSTPSKRSWFISSHRAPPAHSSIINRRQLLSPSCHRQPPRRTTICLIIVHDRDEKDSERQSPPITTKTPRSPTPATHTIKPPSPLPQPNTKIIFIFPIPHHRREKKKPAHPCCSPATSEEGDSHQEPASHLSSPSLSLDDDHVRKEESSPASLPTTAIEGEQQRATTCNLACHGARRPSPLITKKETRHYRSLPCYHHLTTINTIEEIMVHLQPPSTACPLFHHQPTPASFTILPSSTAEKDNHLPHHRSR
ncbi:hypothetical protein Dimus_019918 [Dionaea muscipula]